MTRTCRLSRLAGLAMGSAVPLLAFGAEPTSVHDLVIHHGTVDDGSGRPGLPGRVAIDDDRITYVGPERGMHGRTEIDAKGQGKGGDWGRRWRLPQVGEGLELGDVGRGRPMKVDRHQSAN